MSVGAVPQIASMEGQPREYRSGQTLHNEGTHIARHPRFRRFESLGSCTLRRVDSLWASSFRFDDWPLQRILVPAQASILGDVVSAALCHRGRQVEAM